MNLVDSVKSSGGTAHIFSSMHVSGERELIFLFALHSCSNPPSHPCICQENVFIWKRIYIEFSRTLDFHSFLKHSGWDIKRFRQVFFEEKY